MVIRVGFIREHFASPLLQFAADDKEQTFKLVECPGGTGQIIKAFKDNEIDVGIALTDALIAGIANGNGDYLLAGHYVSTPLNWAVIVGKDSPYQKIEDLRGTTIGISRIGSGSQTMAAVMAQQQGWYTDAEKTQVEKFRYKVNNNIDGLIASVNDGSTSAFMWEWFTTKPFADKGLVRFIGSVPTPWPSWMVATSTSPTRPSSDDIRWFTSRLSEYIHTFAEGLHKTIPFGFESNVADEDPALTEARAKRSPIASQSRDVAEERNVKFIMENFGYPEKDVREWLDTVGYTSDVQVIDLSVIVHTLEGLEVAGVVTRPEEGYDAEKFVDGKLVIFK